MNSLNQMPDSQDEHQFRICETCNNTLTAQIKVRPPKDGHIHYEEQFNGKFISYTTTNGIIVSIKCTTDHPQSIKPLKSV